MLMEAVASNSTQDSSAQYIQLLLAEIRDINKNVKILEERIGELKNDMVVMSSRYSARESKLEELETWKKKIDEVVSPTQLNALSLEVNELKTFKVKAITIFAVVQFGMAVALFLAKFIK